MKKVCTFIESTAGWLIWCIATLYSLATAATLGNMVTKIIVIIAAFFSGYWFVKGFCDSISKKDDTQVEVDEPVTESKPIGFKQGGTKTKKAAKVTTRTKKAKEQ